MSIAVRRQPTPFDETAGAFTAATPSCCCCCCCLATLVTGIVISGKVPYNQARKSSGNAVAAAVAGALSIPAVFGFAILLAWFGTTLSSSLEGLGLIGPLVGIGLFGLAGHYAKGSVPLYLAGGLGLGLVLTGVAIGEAIAVIALFSWGGSALAVVAWLALGVVGAVVPFLVLKTPQPDPLIDAGSPAGWPSAAQPFDHSDFGAPPAAWGQVASPGPPPSSPPPSAPQPAGPQPASQQPAGPQPWPSQPFGEPPPAHGGELPRLDEYPFLDPLGPVDSSQTGPGPSGPPPFDTPPFEKPPWDQPPSGDQPR